MNVGTRVIRLIVVVTGCAATVVALGSVAHAAPAEPAEASCVYTLSKPFVVEVSGVKMLSATLTSLPCTGDILPNSQTVCVELRGGPAPQCVNRPGYTPAQVFFAPYRPGSTYVSTGTGCGSVGPTYVSACATQGPYTATL